MFIILILVVQALTKFQFTAVTIKIHLIVFQESNRTKRSRGTETETCYMLPLGLSIWPEKRVVSKEDKVTTMETECSFATKNNATRYKDILHFYTNLFSVILSTSYVI